MSKGSISSWRAGSIPKGETLNKIAEYFNVTTDYLLNGVQKVNTAIVSPLEQAILDRRPNLPKVERERLLSILNATIESYLNGIKDSK